MAVPNWKERWLLVVLIAILCLTIYIPASTEAMLFSATVYFLAMTRYFFKYVCWGDEDE
jgi:hypothetical protein